VPCLTVTCESGWDFLEFKKHIQEFTNQLQQ
jgi:pyridoxine 5'-phosphate synthase PdxJ